jgi:hypothetical protein
VPEHGHRAVEHGVRAKTAGPPCLHCASIIIVSRDT